ncbi:hypothetical protein QEN19_003494 [Hanseniaspora menglaensis]
MKQLNRLIVLQNYVLPARKKATGKQIRLLHIVNACLRFKAVLINNKDDCNFWKLISAHLLRKYHFVKQPCVLKTIFKRFFYSNNYHSRVLDKQFNLCIETFYFDNNDYICINSNLNANNNIARSHGNNANGCNGRYSDIEHWSCNSAPFESTVNNHILKITESNIESITTLQNSILKNKLVPLGSIKSPKKYLKNNYTTYDSPDHNGELYRYKRTSPMLSDMFLKANYTGKKKFDRTQISLFDVSFNNYPDWYYQRTDQCNQYTHFNNFIKLNFDIENALLQSHFALFIDIQEPKLESTNGLFTASN